MHTHAHFESIFFSRIQSVHVRTCTYMYLYEFYTYYYLLFHRKQMSILDLVVFSFSFLLSSLFFHCDTQLIFISHPMHHKDPMSNNTTVQCYHLLNLMVYILLARQEFQLFFFSFFFCFEFGLNSRQSFLAEIYEE